MNHHINLWGLSRN